MSFSPAKLHAARTRRKLSIADACRAACWLDAKGQPAHASWIRLERGDIRSPGVDTLLRLARVLGCEITDLLD